MNKKRILIVEDEKPIAGILEYGFKKEEFEVCVAMTGAEALEKAKKFMPNIALLDWMLPDLSGVDVCRLLTEQRNIPIIMLTARNSIDDKLYGLESGADDYITKPFDLREVVARVKAILRRYEKVEHGSAPVLMMGDIQISKIERSVMRGQERLVLTPKEFDLLRYLAKHPRQVFTREILLDQIWGYDYMGDTRTVDIHIQRLRKKLQLGDKIETVFGVGYKYVP